MDFFLRLRPYLQIFSLKLEIKHKLEQWRWLQNGYDILVLETPFDSYSVDTPEDLKKIIERFGDSN